jgi:hypothetical protein
MLLPMRLILVNTLGHFVDPYPELPERLLSPAVIDAGLI